MNNNETLYNTSKRVRRKKIKDIHYPVDKLYYADVNGQESIICETYINHHPKYVRLINLPSYISVEELLDKDFKIIKSLKEEIESKKINVCLLSKDGKEKRNVTIEEIIHILKLISLLENSSYSALNGVCISMTDQISDLLGININSNPSSVLKLRDIEEIVVPATKVLKFKNILFNYIRICMILDDEVTMTQDDYRIKRALNWCKIKSSEVEFTITGNVKEEIVLECSNIIEGFQKPFRNIHKVGIK